MTKTVLMTLSVVLAGVLLTALPAICQPGHPNAPGKGGPPAGRPDGPEGVRPAEPLPVPPLAVEAATNPFLI